MKKIILFIVLAITGISSAQSWQNFGTNGIVNPLNQEFTSQLSLVVSGNNTSHICEVSSANDGQAVVKKLVGNNWTTIGSSIDNNINEAVIAINNQNIPYIFYQYADTNNDVFFNVKKYDGANWVNVGNLSTQMIGGINLQIKIDANNIPYISYLNYSSTDAIVIKKFINNTWTDVSILPNFFVGSHEFDFDNQNNLVLCYHQTSGNSPIVKAYKYDGQFWDDLGTEAVVANDAIKPNLAFDSSNNPIISYLFGTSLTLVVKKFNGTQWIQIADTQTFGTILGHELKIGTDNLPIIAFARTTADLELLEVKKFNGQTWNFITTTSTFDNFKQIFAFDISNDNKPIMIYATGTVEDTTIKSKFYVNNLSINQKEILNDVKIYPNPVIDFINIETKNQINQITIIDLIGKTVFEATTNSSKINVSFLKSGVYFAKIKTEDVEIIQKIYKD